MRKSFMLLLFAVVASFAQNSNEMVTFEGKIANRNSDSLVVYSGRNFKKTLKLDNNGKFESSFEIPSDGLYRAYDGTEGTLLYLKKGYSLNLSMDAKEFDESIVYTGEGAKENNFLAKKALSDEEFGSKLEMLLMEDESRFVKLIDQKKNKDLTNIESAGLDSNLATILKGMVEQESVMMVEYFKSKQKVAQLNGKPSPTFNYENHKGGMTKLEDFKGKYVYIDVWATWCGPCRAEIPHLKKVEEEYKDKNIVFVSISIDEKKDHDKWKKFVSDKQLGGVQLFADNAWSSSFVKEFGINGIPRFILIAPDGNVMMADAPRPSSDRLKSNLDELLQ